MKQAIVLTGILASALLVTAHAASNQNGPNRHVEELQPREELSLTEDVGPYDHSPCTSNHGRYDPHKLGDLRVVHRWRLSPLGERLELKSGWAGPNVGRVYYVKMQPALAHDSIAWWARYGDRTGAQECGRNRFYRDGDKAMLTYAWKPRLGSEYRIRVRTLWIYWVPTNRWLPWNVGL